MSVVALVLALLAALLVGAGVTRGREAVRARADLHKNLGLIYARSGDTAKAVAALRAAREQKPADPEIERALQLLQ